MLDLPYGGGNRIKLDKKGYQKVALAFVLIIGSIVLYVFEFKQFDLVLQMKKLLIISIIIGLGIGFLLAKRISDGEGDTFEKMKIYMITVIFVLVFTPLYMSLLNRWLDFRAPVFKQATFEKADAYISENYGVLKGEDPKIAGYKLILILDQEVLQFKAKENPFPNSKKGDKVNLAIKKGLFGINYISLNQ